MALQVNDFVEAVSALVLEGYDREYRIKDGQLIDLALNSTLAPKSIMVDASLRFDSGIDAGDASHIFAITDRRTNRKGLLIEALDVFDELCKRGSARRLEASLTEPGIGASDVPSRNGLRKIYRSEFDEDTERFVLRIGYPDFPSAGRAGPPRCSVSTRLSKPTCGWCRASFAIRDSPGSPTTVNSPPMTNNRDRAGSPLGRFFGRRW